MAINTRVDVGPPKNHIPVTTHNPFDSNPYELVEQTSEKSNDNLNWHNVAISKQVHKSDNTSFAGAIYQQLPENFTILDQLSPMMGNMTYAHIQKKISWDNPNGLSSPTKIRSVLSNISNFETFQGPFNAKPKPSPKATKKKKKPNLEEIGQRT